MDKRIKEIFSEGKDRRPLYYTIGAFIIILFIWISVINSDSGDIAPSTYDGIQKGRQAVQELKDEVYTKGDSQGEPEQTVGGLFEELGSSRLLTFVLIFMTISVVIPSFMCILRR